MRLLQRHLLLCLPLALALATAPGCRRGGKPVAEVGDSVIRETQWKLYLSEQAKGIDPQVALNQMVRREVAWVLAEQTGLLKGEGWQEAGPKLKRKLMARAYIESLPGRRAPSEDEVRGFFLSHSEERHVFHVLLHSEEEAAKVRKRLEHGEPFEKVAVSASVDPTAKKNQGDAGWMRREAVVPEFAQAVFSAKVGDLCGPFRTEYGWHVALVKERRAPAPEEFEKNKGRLMAAAREMAIKPLRENALVPLRPKYPVTVDETVLALNPTPASIAVDGKRIVGKLGKSSITFQELQQFIKESMGQGGPDHNLSPNTRRRFLEMLCDDIRLETAAEKAGVTDRPEVQAALWQAQREAVYQGFGRNHLRNLKLGDADLSAYHQSHGDKFRGVGSVKLNLLVATDPHSMNAALKDAQQNVAWGTLVARYANKESTGNWNPGFLEVAALKKILPADAVKALSGNPLDSLVGPVDGPEGLMLFRILERKSGEVMPLDQCREEVRFEYLNENGEKLMEAYLDGEGRKGLRIQIHPENLKP